MRKFKEVPSVAGAEETPACMLGIAEALAGRALPERTR